MSSSDLPQRPGAPFATDRYLPVFALLILSLALATFVGSSRGLAALTGVAVIGAIVATLRATGSTPRLMSGVLVAAVVMGVLLVANGITGIDGLTVASNLAVAAALVYAAFTLLRRIFEHSSIGLQQVVAALAAYIQLALVFAFAYSATDNATASSLFVESRAGEVGDYVYFSVVTITTLGYGDLTPATNLGRSLAMIETLFGQILLIVLVAYLVGSLGGNRPSPRPDREHSTKR